jgi:isocitrate dehydrogenase kinase/phosphatase
MSQPVHQESYSHRIAQTMVRGFDKHYRLFRECSASAKGRFERAEWIEGQQAMRERIQFYDDRVRETVEPCKPNSIHRDWTSLCGSKPSCFTSGC